jgi:hypothetical protein
MLKIYYLICKQEKPKMQEKKKKKKKVKKLLRRINLQVKELKMQKKLT